MDKLIDKQTLAILGVALTAAIAVGVATSTDTPTKLDDNGIAIIDPGIDAGAGIDADAGPPTKDLDTAKYNREMLTYRKQHPGAVDLLSAPVQPGDSVTVGVNVDLGKRIADVQPVGGSWKVVGSTSTDRDTSTWIEVTATNTGSEPARFVAIVQTE